MTKNDMVFEVEQLLELYSSVLNKCGIDAAKYKQEFAERQIPQIKEGLTWLKARRQSIEDYFKIRRLLSEEIWERYKHMDTEDFREVILLNTATTNIKKLFVGRPALFRSKKDASKCKRLQKSEE